MSNQAQIKAIVDRIAAEFGVPAQPGEDAPLYGAGSALDSFAFVTLIIAVEQALEDELGVSVTLVDDRAMSQRNSPFRTTGTLVEYIERILA